MTISGVKLNLFKFLHFVAILRSVLLYDTTVLNDQDIHECNFLRVLGTSPAVELSHPSWSRIHAGMHILTRHKGR